jgi:THO complex subunit 3
MDNQADELEEGKIIYDWSPPTGQKQEFFYKGSPISKDQVRTNKKKHEHH